MSYCVASDIQKDFPGVTFDGTASSKVKLATLSEFITDADALINSYLSGRYSVPITGTESLKVLKLYSRTLVSDKVKGILEVKQATNAGANQNVRTGLSTKDVIKLLQDLQDGSAQLSDADLVLEYGGVSSFNVREGKTAEFKKDSENW